MKKSDARKKTEKNEKNTKKTCFSPEKNTKWKKNGFFHNPRYNAYLHGSSTKLNPIFL